MNCDIIRDLLPMYADGLASSASRTLVEEHIRTCPECRLLRDEMCAPLEPEPVDEEQKIMEILRIQRRKQRRKALFTWIGVLFALVLIVWGMMEIRFSGEEIFVSSTNEEKILEEMPELALTDAELFLAETILEIPEIRDAMASDQDSISLKTNALEPHLSAVVPENGRIVDVFTMGPCIYISIVAENRYTCLVYSDGDGTGHVDQIVKTLAISPLDEIGPDGRLGDVDEIYELYYAVGSSMTRCQKIKSRHMWFSFLDMP